MAGEPTLFMTCFQVLDAVFQSNCVINRRGGKPFMITETGATFHLNVTKSNGDVLQLNPG